MNNNYCSQNDPRVSYNVLLIEDNSLLADAIIMILNLITEKKSTFKFSINKALNYESAVLKIQEYSENKPLNIVILDINLGKAANGEKKSGEELAPVIRSKNSNTKILVYTYYNEGYKINSILRNVNPEGFLIKNNLTDLKIFQKTLLKIIRGETYYCSTVANIIREKNKIQHHLDNIDLKILHELSNATKMKDMPHFICLTISGIEKRHRRLKEIFEVETDRALVLKAKEIGFL